MSQNRAALHGKVRSKGRARMEQAVGKLQTIRAHRTSIREDGAELRLVLLDQIRPHGLGLRWSELHSSGASSAIRQAKTRAENLRYVYLFTHSLQTHSLQQAAKRVIQVDDGAGDVLGVLVVHHLQLIGPQFMRPA